MDCKEFKYARLRLGLTQKELGAKIEITERQIRRLESGHTLIKKTISSFLENLIRSEMTYTIPQKMSGTGSIHDIASEYYDRDIFFSKTAIYAVVRSSYYGGHTTHRSMSAAIKTSNANIKYSHKIIDRQGQEYLICGDALVIV